MLKAIYKSLGLDDKFMRLSRGALADQPRQKPQGRLRKKSCATLPTRSATRFAVVYERYEARLRESNALDFDDLLLEAVRLLQHDDADSQPPEPPLRIRDGGRISGHQSQPVRADAAAHAKQRNNIGVVGDEDQSIYGWRGANIRNILDFERDFPGAAIIRLEQNYRSTKNILEAASAVVANNTERNGKMAVDRIRRGRKIALYEAPDSENEALFIADTVEKPPGA